MANAVDYTSRDYAAIRQDMIDQITSRLPEWTSRSPNDFGMVLLELFAYLGDNLSYYADRIANEAFLSTATQRSSVLEIARMLDYTPGGNQAATVTLTFSNTSASSATIPAGTRVATAVDSSTGTQVVFQTLASTTVAASGSSTVTAQHGVTVAGETLGTSSGSPSQDFYLSQTPVVDGSLVLAVDSGLGPVTWTYIEHLIDASSTDSVYTTYTDENGVVHVSFGDNVDGKIPPTGAAITATYVVGGGSVGNVGASTITNILTPVPAGISVTNTTSAVGGADTETLDQIRVNAPRSLLTLSRAVTLDDYANLAQRVSGVAKANAVAAVYSSPTVYIAPRGGGGLDVSNVPTAAFATLKSQTATYLSDKIPATATVTIGDPSYVPIYVTVSVTVLDNYNQTSVANSVISALNTLLSFDNVTFADRIAIGDIYATVLSVPGVQFLTVSVLSRTTTGLADVQLAANEIPVAVASGVTTIAVTASGGIVLS